MLKHPRPEGLPLPGGRAQTPPPASPILSSTFFAQGKQRVRLRTSGRAGGGARRGEGRRGNHSQLFSNRLLTLVNSGSGGATEGGRGAREGATAGRLRVSGGGHSKREKERAKSSPSRSSQLPPIYKDGLTLERGRERERERAQQTSCNTGSLQRLNRNWPNAFCE